MIEIDNCFPLEILMLQNNLMQSEIHKLYEKLEEYGNRLMEYKECFEIMGKGHNSYSKTDMEATFMRMKEECDKKRLLLEIFQYRLITLVSQ